MASLAHVGVTTRADRAAGTPSGGVLGGPDARGSAPARRHGGGVLANLSDSVVAVLIPEGAHHLDLMFSHPLDPPSVTAARAAQRAHMRAWVDQAARRGAGGGPRLGALGSTSRA